MLTLLWLRCVCGAVYPAVRWKPRQINNISFRAIEMLYNPRQLMYYWNDMDLPW